MGWCQTGDRLKSLVAGVVEGVMELVLDPLADGRAYESGSTFANGQMNGVHHNDKAMSQGSGGATEEHSRPETSKSGRWVKVYEKHQGGFGPSGMRMH